ncbi:MAG: endonuclease [Saprospiraceae bacterium]
MRRNLTCIVFLLFSFSFLQAQLSLQDGTSNYVIDFDATVSGVNSGVFTGSGFMTNPSSGQLDADGWAISGLSDGSKDFGISNISGDHARGSSSGGISTGGLYGFDLGGGNRALGVQPTGSDWTPGTITLKISNNSTSVINDMDIDYNIFVRNDQGRASSFNFSYSYDNSSFTNASAGDYTSPAGSGSTAWVANNRVINLSSLGLNPGEDFYLRWSGSDVSGSGSRDEFALDDISITAAGSTNNCTQPTAQANNLNFGTVTSNSIQATFTGGTADKYLVVQSTSSSLGASPSDGVIYTAGSNFGNGEVLQFSNSTSINALNLTSNTLYYFHVFAANDNCSGGPDYLSSSPLTGSVSTQQSGNSNYYSSIGNETCATLKTNLHNLIDGHTSVSYGSLWTHYQTTDDHDNDTGTEVIVWDMYSDNPIGSENEFTFVAEQCGTYQSEGDCYNREHSFPKSWWGGSTSPAQYTDIFTVVPVDGWINGIRSNNPYGEVQSGTETHIMNNGTRLGSSSITIPGYSGSVFEPIDAYKGDLARGYFYMATRYEDVIAGWENNTTEADAVLDGTSDLVFEPWFLNMIINWHNNDPVDQKEIDRNESIYAIQGNRNPFIDHPEYVNLIWNNCSGGDTEAPTIPTNLSASNTTQSSTDLLWTASTDNVGVAGYNIYQGGVNVFSVAGTSTTVNGLTASTSYSFYVTAYDAAGNESVESTAVSVTTQTPADTQAPTIPTNLTASNTTETSTDLSWTASTDNVGVAGYNVYQGGVNVSSVTGTSANVSGLTASTSYSFYVTAYDAAGNESVGSTAISVTTSTPSGSTVLHEGYFESGWDGWTDGGSDCARYSGSRSAEGSYSIRIRDNSGTSSSMTSSSFDLSSYSSVDFDFSFYPNSMETNEDFWVRYNDGSGWQTIATFARGTDFNNNTFYTVSLNLSSSQYNLSNNGSFRIQCDASGNADRVYIDEVIITGNTGGSSYIAPVVTELVVGKQIFENVTDEPAEEIAVTNVLEKENIISIYPNPADEFININAEKIQTEIVSIEILNLMGQVINLPSSQVTEKVLRKNISNLPSGMYFLRIIDIENKQQTIKFYVK